MNKSIIALVLCAACGSSKEATPVQLPAVLSTGGLTATTNDLGFDVIVTELRMAAQNFQFTIEGEQQVSMLDRIGNFLVPNAYAHPGHAAGGEVTGELPGAFLLDFASDGAALGTATLLPGLYHGVNFTFRTATTDDGLDIDDPLLDHSIVVGGTAQNGGAPIAFQIVLDIDPNTNLIGAPFEFELLPNSTATIALEVLTQDPFEEDTMFDGVDFAALDPDLDGSITIGPNTETHNRVRRAFEAHDFYFVRTR